MSGNPVGGIEIEMLQRFVMIRNPRADAGELIVVENFFEELKANVGK